MLDLRVLFEQWEPPLQRVLTKNDVNEQQEQLHLLSSVDFLLELLTVAKRVVHIVVDNALHTLIVTQVALIVP